MADAVPVSDALCEAIEYLSRLGSNLRVRSENFKQKKLRKDRLKNTHAVQKAANKVLLICELSKKSILNVEDGVKQILTQIDAAQKYKKSTNESTREFAYEYFMFDSQRLKIRNKINLNHFTSVKVLAKAMPLSMQDKYPLYYVCNLFHLREQQGTQKCDDHQSTEINILNNSCNESPSHFSSNNSTEKQDTDILHSDVANKSDIIENNDSTTTIQKDQIQEKSPPKNHKKYKNIKIIDDSSDSNDNLDSLQTIENIVENNDVANIETVDTSSTNKDIHMEENTQQCSDIKDTLGENTSKLLSDTQKINKNAETISQNKPDMMYTNVKNTNEVENQTKSYFDQDTNDSKTENYSANTDAEKYANNSDNDLCIDSNITNTTKELKSESKSISDDNSLCSTDSRPLIKCVNINKLLRKDKIPKTRESVIEILESDSDDDITVKNKKHKHNQKHKSKTKLLSFKNQINQLSEKCTKDVQNDDQDFWNKKRQELKKFKPKQFTVNIIRMPKLTEQFLHKYNLNRIIQNGSIVCEMPLEKRDVPIKCKSNEKKERNVVKSALFSDSDSDCEKEMVKVTELKKALLDESDPFEEQEKSTFAESGENKNSDKNMSKDKQRSTMPMEQESENNNGSSDTNTKCRKRKRKNRHSNSPLAFKRKCIMKSVHAKKMLLNCSSSSDTDEGVKNTLKDIKNSLLIGESDEDIEIRQKAGLDPEVTKLNKNNSNTEGDISNKDPSQENNEVNLNNSSEKVDNENENIEKTKSKVSEDDINSEKSTNKDKQQTETSSEQKSENYNDKQKRSKRNVEAKKKFNNCSSSSDTDDKGVENVIKDIKDSLLKWESDEDVEMKQLSGSNQEFSKSNKEDSNSECVIPTDDTTQINSKLNSHSSSENINNENGNINKAKSVESEDDRNNEEGINKDKQQTENSSEQESETNNDSSKSPILYKQRCKKRSVKEKKKFKNCTSSSDTDDEGVDSSLLKGGLDNKTGKKSGSDAEVTESNTRSSQDRSNSECDISTKDSSSQGNEVNSNSSSKKMGRSKSKPDGSSSQNSDTQESYDKDLDGLTNLKTLSKKRRRRRRRRRRRSPSSDRSQSTSSNSVKTMPKAPLISEEGFLKAETSSDAASLADSDVGEEVEIPAVSMSGLNGDSIDHLAKADLLEQSNSSDSHEKSSNDYKKEYESDEDNVKSKRRKANAISSDSDAGGSRRKGRGVKLSDFEDSEDDSEPTKKSKRKKKKNHDSDASASSSIEASKKKRRRIKHVDDSDDASGSESETEGRNKHGRKNIRKVMGKNQLEEATKKAAREEKERIARIAERQKLYNNLQFDESGKPDEVVLDKVVLDFDPETKEPLIEVDKGLVKKLKPHQANGIKFMWDACFESVKRIKKDKGSGCILAHCMGLGKTLQVVSLTHTLLTHGALTGVRRVLVVCPLSTVLNWVNEFGIWLKHAHADYEVDVYELSRHKQNSERAWQLQQWFSGGGVCVLGYEMFRNLSADNSKKFKKKMLKSFQESLVDPGPDLVVCDEGHLLKNEKTSLSQAMNRVKTLRRIVLTGTPLQNNLKEYYCMVQFVKPNLLGKYNEYLNRFVNPITNGQYTDSTEHDIRVMKRRSHVLHKMLDGAVQRRDYGVLAPFLPPKHEYVLFITLTEVQVKLYQHYLDNYSRRPLPGKSSGFLFPDFQSLQRIWTHPLVLKYNSERYEIMQQKKREREEEDSEGSIADFIDDDSTPDESSTEESSDSLSDLSDDSQKKRKKKKSTKKSKAKDTKVTTRRGTRANPIDADDDDVILEDDVQVKSENPTEWWMSLVTEDELDDLRHSHKLVLLFDILRQCETIGDKLLVFSQSLYSLDLIEHFLGKVDEATQEARVDEKLNGHVGSWSPGVDYFRLDGSTSCENRSIWCKNFNKEDNPRARLFLISTRAGGLGINLVAANRVVIFDVSWNPSHDVQSIFRVYRFGQKKPCYIYRFLAMGTMEEKIYERQVTKQAISKRVIDEQQIDRHYAENDLAELYKFEPRPPAPRELPPLPKDRLFAEMLREHEAQIYKYHEHDSLLENKEEETLTEEERKAAWEDFENEKTRPPPAPLSYMHNGMMPGLLQQQQQLAYATFAALLHKEMPNASDAQIREALYRSNPAMFGGYDYGLLQKMGELYKYAQPGMMNPAMMNPAMNAAGGMALGGSSGLQYEPPWQRQQQMRMQQLLQQNQQMGAKLYAGGLGSRDPVAMALQQQRAREMMLGERGRPRGRPRHDAPPAALSPADVVNLDSD